MDAGNHSPLAKLVMTDDRQLMLQVQAGDHARFSELVDRFRARLVRFATSSLNDRQIAEDLAQETFLAVYQARHTYNPDFAFSTWIWTIHLNLVRRERVRRSRRVEREAIAGERRPSHWQPWTEEREQLDRWLSQIPEAEADALRLRFFGELSFEEIALSMDSSLSGAKLRVRNGLQRLSELARHETGLPRPGDRQ